VVLHQKVRLRREWNSHEFQRSVELRLEPAKESKKNQQPDFGRAQRERQPVQKHEEAARGDESVVKSTSVRQFGARMNE
jgi:hypothetical protein